MPFLASLGPCLTLVSFTRPVPNPFIWGDIPAWLHPLPKDMPAAASALPAALPLAEVMGMAQDAKCCPALLTWAVLQSPNHRELL